jgi:DNA-binding GntR family transcriptional regulator
MQKRLTAKLTQTERAYSKLKRAILQGDLGEGTFLREPEVMSLFGIGRTPYREACNRLHHERLLQAVPRRGYFVSEISFQSVCDLFEMRLVFEDAVAQFATARATEAEIGALEALSACPLPTGNTQAELTQFIRANSEFHLGLAKTTRNKELVDQLARNLESTQRLQYIELRSGRFRAKEFLTFHGRIIEALKRRDVSAVRKAILADITEAQNTALAFGQGGVEPTLDVSDLWHANPSRAFPKLVKADPGNSASRKREG